MLETRGRRSNGECTAWHSRPYHFRSSRLPRPSQIAQIFPKAKGMPLGNLPWVGRFAEGGRALNQPVG